MDPEIPYSPQKMGREQQQSTSSASLASSTDPTPLFNLASDNNNNNNNNNNNDNNNNHHNHHDELGNHVDMAQALFKAQTTANPPFPSFKSNSTKAHIHIDTHTHHRGGDSPQVVILWIFIAVLVCLTIGFLALLSTKLWCKWKGWREERKRRKMLGEREWFRMSDLSGVGQP